MGRLSFRTTRWIALVIVVLLAIVLALGLNGAELLAYWSFTQRGSSTSSPLSSTSDDGGVIGARGAVPGDIGGFHLDALAGGAAPIAEGRRSTFLLMGIDQRENEIPRADVIMLASVESGGRVTVLSIPRDLWLSIPGHGTDRINAAYAFGAAEGSPTDGAQLLKDTVGQNFGVSVDHYVVGDFDCFARIVDALDGVTVDVPEAVADEQFWDRQGTAATLHFDAGRQTMTGERALQYVRTRHADSDFQRMERQQAVLKAIFEERPSLDEIVGLARVVSSGCSRFRSDLSTPDLIQFAVGLWGVSRDRVSMSTVGRSMVNPEVTAGGAEVLRPRWERIRPMILEKFGTE